MASTEKMIAWMEARRGKVTYSMAYRLGPNSYDCSSAVFNALIAGGFLPASTPIGNTESLYQLEGKILTPITRSQVRRGDIFVAGYKGYSVNAAGHTGIFVSNSQIIHCSYSMNGIAVTQATGYMGDYSGLPVYFYRIKGAVSQAPKQQFVIEQGNVATVDYDGKGKVRLADSKGTYIDKYLAPGTRWKVSSTAVLPKIGLALCVGRNEFLPLKYSNWKDFYINYTPGYGVNSYSSKFAQNKGSNKKFKTNTHWKTTDFIQRDGRIYFGAGADNYIKSEHVKFGA